MPARLANFSSHMPCNFTPPFALIDPAARTVTTALNADGDGWSPMVDIVRLECPSPTPATGSALPLELAASKATSLPFVCVAIRSIVSLLQR